MERKPQMTPDDLASLPSSGFREPPRGAAWMQVNVALVRADGDAIPSARALFGAVVPRLDRFDRDGALHGWFFMRKPPDVRMRILVDAEADDVAGALDRTLQDTQDRGQIERFFWSEYAPEQERFGGPDGMMLAHAYFHVDSRLWFHLDELDARGVRKATADEILPAIVHDMFQRCCGPERADQAWRELDALVCDTRIIADLGAPSLPSALDALAFAQGRDSEEGAVLRSYVAANELLCKGLAGLEDDLPVDRSPSAIAATVALFNLNRHGFRGERSAAMTARVILAIDAQQSKRQAITDTQRQHIKR
ncbi:MAG: thiopeptide-type bacteriocin biosynthesis protein [Betaproteobacteria bacterium]